MAERLSKSARVLTDPEEIRRWAESQGGRPARVKLTGRAGRKRGDPGIIRIDFPGFSGEESLEPISWEEWFDAFEKNNLALIVSTDPRKPRFNKIVSRDTVQERTRARAPARKPAARRGTKRATAATKRRSAGRR